MSRIVKHLNIRITGRVQGVFFRQSCRDKAEALNITGFAQNMPDGSVYLELEGEESALNVLATWCRGGTKLAHVEKTEVEPGPLKHFTEFTIR